MGSGETGQSKAQKCMCRRRARQRVREPGDGGVRPPRVVEGTSKRKGEGKGNMAGAEERSGEKKKKGRDTRWSGKCGESARKRRERGDEPRGEKGGEKRRRSGQRRLGKMRRGRESKGRGTARAALPAVGALCASPPAIVQSSARSPPARGPRRAGSGRPGEARAPLDGRGASRPGRTRPGRPRGAGGRGPSAGRGLGGSRHRSRTEPFPAARPAGPARPG